MSVGYPESVPNRPLTSKDHFGEIHAPHMPSYPQTPRGESNYPHTQLFPSHKYTAWDGFVDCLPLYALFAVPVAVSIILWVSEHPEVLSTLRR